MTATESPREPSKPADSIISRAPLVFMVRHVALGILATMSPSLRSHSALTEISSSSSLKSSASLHSMPWDLIHRLNALTRLCYVFSDSQRLWLPIIKYSEGKETEGLPGGHCIGV